MYISVLLLLSFSVAAPGGVAVPARAAAMDAGLPSLARQEGRTPLHFAAENGLTAAVSGRLVSARADVDAVAKVTERDKFTDTPRRVGRGARLPNSPTPTRSPRPASTRSPTLSGDTVLPPVPIPPTPAGRELAGRAS